MKILSQRKGWTTNPEGFGILCSDTQHHECEKHGRCQDQGESWVDYKGRYDQCQKTCITIEVE